MTRFAKYAWGVLAYNLVVILWGAFVRASGSGAGCGSHWPLCNGEVIPIMPQISTLIEFTHRLMSGAALLSVVVLLIWAMRKYQPRHLVRRGAGFSMLFMITEALVGAGLVLLQLVAENTSIARGFSISIHLVNTFLLLACLSLTAWWASGGRPLTIRKGGEVAWVLGIGLAGMLVLGMSGAITALGDTLFPANSFSEGLRQELSATTHIFLRLRILHPTIAVVVSIYLILATSWVTVVRPGTQLTNLRRGLSILVAIQILAGVVNVFLLAPIWLQLVHLLISDTIWILLVLFSANALAEYPQILPSQRKSAISVKDGSAV
jgi:heme A synthase